MSSMLLRWLNQYLVLISLLLILATFALAAENFLSFATFSAILNQLPALTLVTVGMTFVLICGGIDLSVGSVLALSSAVIGISVAAGFSIPVAALAGVTAGGLAGLVNGLLGSYLRLPVFIVTLGMLEAARGAAYLITDSQTVYIGSAIQGIVQPIPWLGLTPAFLCALAVVAGAHFVLSSTVFGRHVIAVGTNPDAARISGIDPKRTLLIVLCLSGVLAGLAGLMNAAYLGSTDPNAGSGLELAAIAAAVIGGTSLMGGRGSIFSAFIGVLIIAVLQNGLAQIGVSEPFKRVVTGVVIVLAVVLDRWRADRSF